MFSRKGAIFWSLIGLHVTYLASALSFPDLLISSNSKKLFFTSDISIPPFSIALLQNVHENSQTKTWPLSLELKLINHDLFLTEVSLVQSRGQFLGLWDNSWDWWTPTGRYLADLSCLFVGYICSVFGIQWDTTARLLHVEITSFISLKFSRWGKSTFREVKLFF